ncbi:hypothetical protein ACH5RR_014387 [Cinchona calisaya]|uniref:Gibberellin-regulated protein 14 n=1 Tax=Cinchona calisaya TaxID=153742 RepID=A0ABD3A640_9GENT
MALKSLLFAFAFVLLVSTTMVTSTEEDAIETERRHHHHHHHRHHHEKPPMKVQTYPQPKAPAYPPKPAHSNAERNSSSIFLFPEQAMASKATSIMLFVLASFLLLTTRVSSNSEELFVKDIYQKVPPPPIKASLSPPPPPATKTSPQPPPPPIYKPVPVPPPVKKLPPPPPPPYKQVPSPPVKKPPQPSPPPPPVKAPAPPPSPIKPPPRNTKECFPLCVVRCKFHSRKNVCLRACVTCCDRCKCVPPGQYGNREKCGKCYANMTTHGGMLKCP